MKSMPVFFPPRLWPRRYQQQGLREEQSNLTKALEELARYKQSASAVKPSTQNTASDLPALPSSRTIDQVVSDMTRLAQQHRVQLANLSIEATAKSAQALAQQQIAVQAKGDYAGLKAWTGEMLARSHGWRLKV